MSESFDRDKVTGRFLAGNSGNGGRPRGARSRLGEQFLQDLQTTWQEHGIAALRRCAVEEPSQYCRIVAGLLPKEAVLDVDINVFHEVGSIVQAFRIASQVLEIDPKREKAGLRRLAVDDDE